jgi:hypothetical protein
MFYHVYVYGFSTHMVLPCVWFSYVHSFAMYVSLVYRWFHYVGLHSRHLFLIQQSYCLWFSYIYGFSMYLVYIMSSHGQTLSSKKKHGPSFQL